MPSSKNAIRFGVDANLHAALSDVTVIDLSRLIPGPHCSALLVEMGAKVIKVEDLDRGDYLRWFAPEYETAPFSARSAKFQALNHHKRSIRINLKDERGRAVFKQLARSSDVVLESFRPGVMDRLGVGYKVLHADNPRLIYCALSGYGQQGPNAQRSGHDLNYVGRSGLLALNAQSGGGGQDDRSGYRDSDARADGSDQPPNRSVQNDRVLIIPPVQLADTGGALLAALQIVAALRSRDRTGEGVFLDIALADAPFELMRTQFADIDAGGEVVAGQGLLTGGYVCYNVYRCADGWVTFAPLELKFWERWCNGVERPDLIDKQFERSGSSTHNEIKEIFVSATRADWQQFADKHDCCLEVIVEPQEAYHCSAGEGAVSGAYLSASMRGDGGTAAPALGGDTEVVLSEFGYSDAEIEELKKGRVVGGLIERDVEKNTGARKNPCPDS